MHLLISKKIIIYLLIFCFLVSIHNISLMNFNFPKINKIEIIGLNLNEKKRIENIINDANFKNIFYLDKQYLKKKIGSINIIEHFEIFKNYPSTLKITIKEKNPVAILLIDKKKYLVSSSGEQINFIENNKFNDLPVIFGADIKKFQVLYKTLESINFNIEID